MKRRRVVVLGFVGTTLDAKGGAGRWDRWRPTVAMTQQDDFQIDRLELLHGVEARPLAEAVRADIGLTSPKTVVKLHSLRHEDAWDFERVYTALYEFSQSYTFDVEHEDYFVHITTGSHVVQICLFLLTESRRIPARLLQTSPNRGNTSARDDGGSRGARPSNRQGARRTAEGSYAIIDLDLSKYDELAKRFHKEQIQGLSVLKSGIATQNRNFNELISQVEHVASHSGAPILLLGATGSGKSQLAKRIVELKKARRLIQGEFAEVNCATLRGDSAMSTLFGHQKGAFTGAVQGRPGLLRQADRGVLFLDEIGELGLDEQAMLLRAIEEGVFYPLGSDIPQRSEFQLISGTNRDLHDAVSQGRFRADLYARINLWTFRLPNLNERPEDLEPNLDFELERVARATGSHYSLSREARSSFINFARTWPWPGNFRDFAGAVTRMATFAEGGRITEGVVQAEIARIQRAAPPHRDDAALTPSTTLLGAGAAQLDRFDRVQLDDVLRVCASAASLSEAGRTLFAVSRAAKQSTNDTDRLKKYLARFGLEFAEIRRHAPQRLRSP